MIGRELKQYRIVEAIGADSWTIDGVAVLVTAETESKDSIVVGDLVEVEALETIAIRVGAPVSQVLGIATFFRAFSLKPVGRYPIQVCMGTACHVQGAPRLLDALLRELKIGKDETTDDMLFGVKTVNCLGCCGLAPVITVDQDVHGKLKQATVPRLLKKYRTKAEKEEPKH